MQTIIKTVYEKRADFMRKTGLTPTHLIIGEYEKHQLHRSPEFKNTTDRDSIIEMIFYGCKILVDKTARGYKFAYTLGD